MPRPSRRPAILEAALACFAERGYDGTRIKHIAERAGVAESALYRHYPSKEAVAQELFGAFVARYAARLAEIADADLEPELKLATVVRTVLSTYRSEPDAFVFAVLGTHQRLPRLPAGSVYPLDVVERIVVEAQDAGVVRAGRTNLLASILVGVALQPVVLATLSRPGAFDLLGEREHDEVIVAAALAAVRKESS